MNKKIETAIERVKNQLALERRTRTTEEHALSTGDFYLSDIDEILATLSNNLERALTPAVARPSGEVDCSYCGGDGIERCDNPDHGLLNAISFRGANESACPCCGHDEKYRMKTWDKDTSKYIWNKCPECSGTGRSTKSLSAGDARRVVEALKHAKTCVPFPSDCHLKVKEALEIMSRVTTEVRRG